MRILIASRGDTIVVSPLVKRERLPLFTKLIVEDGISYIPTADIFEPKIAIGTILAGYEMVSHDKYEIIFKTKTPPKRTYKKYKK